MEARHSFDFAPVLCSLLLPLAMPASGREADCRLLSVMSGADAPGEVFVAGGRGKGHVRLEPSSSMLAEPVEIPVPDDGVLRFFDARDAREPVATTVAPKGAESLVILLLPDGDPDDEVPFRCAALDSGSDELKGGGTVFFNAGPFEARIKVGEDSHDVAAGGSIVIPNPEELEGNQMTSVLVEVLLDERWRRLKDTSSRMVEGMVVWMVAHEPPGAGRPRLSIFKQR